MQDSALDKFLSWIKKNQIYIHPQITLIRDANGRISVYTTEKPVPPDQIILRIPKALVLSPRNSQIGPILDNFKIKTEIVKLCLTLMYEKSLGTKSFWNDYIALLPDFEPIPRLWTDEEKQWLKGTEVEAIKGLDENSLLKTFDRVVNPVFTSCSIFSDSSIFNYSAYKRCMSVVFSRCFEVDKFRPLALVPFADLLNHTCFQETVHFVTCFDVCEKCGKLTCHCNNTGIYIENSGLDDMELEDPCEMVIVTHAEPHSQVFNTYGDLGNDVLVSRYGFAVQDNPHDTVSILASDIFSQVENDRKLLWTRHGKEIIKAVAKDIPSFPMNGQDVSLHDQLNIQFDGKPSFELVCTLFLATGDYTSPVDSTLTTTLHFAIKHYHDIISTNTQKVLPVLQPVFYLGFTKLLKCLEARESRYVDSSVSWQDYDYMLASAPDRIDCNRRTAFTVLRNEKRILYKCCELCNFILSKCE